MKLTNMQKETIRVNIRLFEKLNVIVAGIIPYIYVWHNFINPMMNHPFVNKGNLLMVGL